MSIIPYHTNITLTDYRLVTQPESKSVYLLIKHSKDFIINYTANTKTIVTNICRDVNSKSNSIF